jgi:hypothetical protein
MPVTLHILKDVAIVVLTVAAAGVVTRQCRKPSWWPGREFLWIMNSSHAHVTNWGIGHVSIEKDFTILDVGCGGGRAIRTLAGMAQQDLAQPFGLSGWALDEDAAAGTGVDTLHVWAYPLAGGPPVFLGQATSGLARSDVAAVHGAQFRDSGFSVDVAGLVPGNYDLAVFAWSAVSGGFVPAQVVRVTAR